MRTGLGPSVSHLGFRSGSTAWVGSRSRATGLLLLMLAGPWAMAAPDHRTSIAFTVDTAAAKNLFWDAAPVVRLHLENKSNEAVPPLRYELHAQEMYYDREAWSVRDAFREIPPGANIDHDETLTVPFGVYRVKWLLADAEGEFQSGSLDLARMMPACDRDGPDMQAALGLFDVLDAPCTHTYAGNDSPEACKVYETLGQVDESIDRMGGMRLQWATWFGWPHDLAVQRRAEWIPRYFIACAAAGVERDGLYAWEGDCGILQNTAQPATASVHALAKMIEGRRFAGLIGHDENLWVCVFERAGRPLAVGWSPAGNALWTVGVRDGFSVHDLFGSPMSVQATAGKITVHVTGAPVYVMNIADSVLAEAAANQCKREHERFAEHGGRAGYAP